MPSDTQSRLYGTVSLEERNRMNGLSSRKDWRTGDCRSTPLLKRLATKSFTWKTVV